jgi:isopentenyldiphosphate isomerase
MTDLDRVRALVRELHRELGLDADQMPKKKKVAETRYEDAPDGWVQIDIDEEGVEVQRQFLPARTMSRGMKSAGGE